MKRLVVLLCVALCGCQTVIRDPRTGVAVVQSNVDFTELTYSDDHIHANIKGHRPSKTIGAVGQAGTGIISAAGTAVGLFY